MSHQHFAKHACSLFQLFLRVLTLGVVENGNCPTVSEGFTHSCLVMVSNKKGNKACEPSECFTVD